MIKITFALISGGLLAPFWKGPSSSTQETLLIYTSQPTTCQIPWPRSVSPLSLPAQPLLCSNCCTNQHKIKCSHPQQGESAEQGPLETADTVLQLLYYRIRHFRSNSQHGTSSSMKRFIHPSPDCSRVNIFNFSVHQKAQFLHNSSPQANDLRYLLPEVFLGQIHFDCFRQMKTLTQSFL